MAIREISEDEFNSYNIGRAPSLMLAEEISWFADDEAKLLGTVLIDKIDKDWSYIILALESDGVYRYADGKVSVEDQEECEEDLKYTIYNISVNGNFSETLFELDNEPPIIEQSSLIVRDIDDEVKRYFNKHPEKLYDLNPRKFEELIASILKDFGFDVELTKATRDGGRDIIARIKDSVVDTLAYVECKRYAADRKIDVGIIREVIGVHYIRKPSKSIIVTTSFFTKAAVAEAKTLENQLELKDFNQVKEWLKQY
jgi:HJR/Mrr/RecB family endonuclease